MKFQDRYQLDNSQLGRKKKYTCPSCQRKNRFSLYVDLQEREYLPDHVGKCDRVDSCGYWLTAWDYIQDNKGLEKRATTQPLAEPKEKLPSFIPISNVSLSIERQKKGTLYQALINIFEVEAVDKVFYDYMVGSEENGSTIFWQIDAFKRVHTGKIMQYEGLHRTSHFKWAHSTYGANFGLFQCLFGSHLLTKENTKPLAVVESEKTALIGAIDQPKYTWLATGSANNFKQVEAVKLLGREIVLFPDNGQYEHWKLKANEMGLKYYLVNTLEGEEAINRYGKGCDIADYVLYNKKG